MASSMAHAQRKSKIEQIVVEFFAKSLQIILETRVPGLCEQVTSSFTSSTTKTRDRWFNLALGDCTVALENFGSWRTSFLDPLVVDIVLDPMELIAPSDNECSKTGASQGKGSGGGFSSNTGEGNLLERWTVQFEDRKGSSYTVSSKAALSCSKASDGKKLSSTDLGKAQEAMCFNKDSWAFESHGSSTDASERRGTAAVLPMHVTEVPAVYKRTVIMLRSLYCRSRLLPAYHLFRLASTPSNSCTFNLRYRVLASASPLSEHDKREMMVYDFTPVETVLGRMRLSVAYRHTTAVTAVEVTPSILPRIIPDYVGSPTTDPLKRFPAKPHSLPSSGISLCRGVRMVSVPPSLQNSPPGSSLDRRHSWSGRVDGMQPALQPPSPSYHISRPPSPSYPFHNSPSPFSLYSQKHPSSDHSPSPLGSPLSSADCVSSGHPITLYKQTGVSQPISIAINNRFSPPFSPSPSPSPPATYPVSAPVSIPKACHLGVSKYNMVEVQQQCRNLLPPLSPSTRKTAQIRSSSESPRYIRQGTSQKHQSRSFESPMQLHVSDNHDQQVWKNDVGAIPSSIEIFFHGQSKATTFSRSLPRSKSGLGDDTEDEDFSCPFAVDDVETEEKPSSRNNISGSMVSSRLSLQGTQRQGLHDAAVGALVRVLKSASPLRQAFCPALETQENPYLSSEAERRELTMSGGGDVPHAAATTSGGVRLSTVANKKTAVDAINEFQLYKDIKDRMLRQSMNTRHEHDPKF